MSTSIVVVADIIISVVEKISDSLQTRLATLHAELAELRQRRQQQEIEIANIENIKLRQRFQEILDNLLTQEMQKVQEVIL